MKPESRLYGPGGKLSIQSQPKATYFPMTHSNNSFLPTYAFGIVPPPMKKSAPVKVETKKELIQRLLAKASLDFKCCGHKAGPKK